MERPVGEALQGLQGRPHVGALGVVVPDDAAELPDLLQPMGQTGEVSQGLGEAAGIGPHRSRQKARRHGVLEVVGPGEAQVSLLEELHLGTTGSRLDDAIVQEPTTVLDRGGPREESAAGFQVQTGNDRIVGIENRLIARLLALEDPTLGREVAGQVAVPVQVIARQIEQGGGPRSEAVHRLELEARHLGHEDPSFGAVHAGRQGPADVAADLDLHAGRLEQRAGHCRRRALAVAAGDADHGAVGRREAQLHLGDDHGALSPRPPQERRVDGDPRAHHDPVHFDRSLFRIGSQMGREARVRRQLGEVRRLAPIDAHHLDAPGPEQPGRGETRPSQAVDQDTSPLLWLPGHSHQRSFRVERLMRAKRMATIQNRTMTFGSGQPESSKWWWSGAILRIRRPPVALKNATCKITDSTSMTKSPPTRTRTTSCFERMATMPMAPPMASEPTSPMNISAG